MTAKNIRRVIAAVSLVVLLGCSMMHLAGCSSILGLPEDGPVQTMTPEEQSTRRVFTSPDGPADDAQPEAIVKGFSTSCLRECRVTGSPRASSSLPMAPHQGGMPITGLRYMPTCRNSCVRPARWSQGKAGRKPW